METMEKTKSQIIKQCLEATLLNIEWDIKQSMIPGYGGVGVNISNREEIYQIIIDDLREKGYKCILKDEKWWDKNNRKLVIIWNEFKKVKYISYNEGLV